MTQSTEEYDRGHIAGRIEERLTRHEAHLGQINGSMADVARELADLNLGMQALRDQQESSAIAAVAAAAALEKTVATTAKALREANDARRQTSEVRWSPWAKLLAALGGVATLLVLITAIQSWGPG